MIINENSEQWEIKDNKFVKCEDGGKTIYQMAYCLSGKEIISLVKNTEGIEYLMTELSEKYEFVDDAIVACEKPFKKVKDLNKKLLQAEAFHLDWNPDNCTTLYFSKYK